MGFAAALPLLLAAGSAGLSYVNTRNTAKREDQALATQIRNQGDKQRKVDSRVNEEVTKLQGSTAEKSRKEGLDSYMQALLTNKAKTQNGLNPGFGSKAFQADAREAGADVNAYADETAGLMSRIDAPGQQRQDEAFGYGKLATDVGLLSREARGQNFLDELRVRNVRRNPGMDALSSFLGGAAGGNFGGMFGGGTTGFGVPGMTSPTGLGVTYGTGRGLAAAGFSPRVSY